MKITLDLHEYEGNGRYMEWEKDATYSIDVLDNEVVLVANKQGLISLAKQMLYMAYNDFPAGTHFHYDSFFAQNPASDYELTVEKGDN
ncbi:MAG: hypothetical protein IKV52_03375 [Oscillospiraceae bacterium]|nr:hypothetical protein [Oscillospiraceae bacterium]